MTHSPNCKLVSAKIGRAEYFSKEDREKHGLPEEGLVVTEMWDCKCEKVEE